MKIGIVNDMPMIAEALRRTVTHNFAHEVDWIAHDGAAAIEYCRVQKPDLILLDLIMPGIDGVEVTRQIMQHSPCPILLVTSSISSNMNLVFQALGQGALDAVDTPQLGGANAEASITALLNKINQIARIVSDKPSVFSPSSKQSSATESAASLVVMGASAGGPAALNAVLSALPSDFDAAVLLVQHIDAEFVGNLAKWLALECVLPLRLAVEGDRIKPGTVLLAGADGHLVMTSDLRLRYIQEPRDSAYQPSVNVLFESVCKYWRGNLAAVLLSGMGTDGAKGLKAIRDKGHYTIAQDKTTSAIYGMPKAAVELGAAIDILPVKAIAPKLTHFLTKQERKHASIQ
jgi:two-component system, chemotaxis family, response regulator WspF